MLTEQDRQAVVKELRRAFLEYRDLPIWLVCKRARVYPSKTNYRYGGVMHNNGALQYPGNAPSIGKEDTFWHELCHWLLWDVLPHQKDGEMYWVHERICDAFGNLMTLYRRGVLTWRQWINLEQWIFEDMRSVGYAEVTVASMHRVARARDEALHAGRIVDSSELDIMLRWMERYWYRVQMQQVLPVALYPRRPGLHPRFVDDEKDLRRQYEISKDKASWKSLLPIERRFLAEKKILTGLSDQLALFPEVAHADRAELERRLRLLDRAAIRFQKS